MDQSKKKDKEYTIIVNGRENVFEEKKISFDQVVSLAFNTGNSGNNTIYTVTYSRGHGNKKEGTMVSGDCVRVKEGMIFNVTATDKS